MLDGLEVLLLLFRLPTKVIINFGQDYCKSDHHDHGSFRENLKHILDKDRLVVGIPEVMSWGQINELKRQSNGVNKRSVRDI